MKAAVWTDTGTIQIMDVNTPEIGPHEVLVNVKCAGICGSDLTIFQGKFPEERAIPPMILGHEFSGAVAAVGSDVKRVRPGDRVAVDPLISCGLCHPCRDGNPHVCASLKLIGVDMDGGFAEYVKADAERVYILPDELTYELGAMVEPLAVAVHAISRSSLKQGDHVVVIGAGPIGMLTAMAAADAGADNVIVVETNDYRRKLVQDMGFSVINPQYSDELKIGQQCNKGKGPEVIYEATGTTAGLQYAIDSVSIRGQVMIVGVPKGVTNLDIRRTNFAEHTITGARVYSSLDIEKAVSMLADKRIEVDRIIETFPLDKCESLCKELLTGSSRIVKCLLRI